MKRPWETVVWGRRPSISFPGFLPILRKWWLTVPQDHLKYMFYDMIYYMIMNVYTIFFVSKILIILNSWISQSRSKQLTVYYMTAKLFDCFMILETRKKTQETVRNIVALGKVIIFFTYSLIFFNDTNTYFFGHLWNKLKNIRYGKKGNQNVLSRSDKLSYRNSRLTRDFRHAIPFFVIKTKEMLKHFTFKSNRKFI